MTKLEHAAYSWWLMKRPLEFDETEHMKHPAVNCVGASEAALAHEVVNNIQRNNQGKLNGN